LDPAYEDSDDLVTSNGVHATEQASDKLVLFMSAGSGENKTGQGLKTLEEFKNKKKINFIK